MILDYAKPDTSLRRFWAKWHREIIVLLLCMCFFVLVYFLGSGYSRMQWVNYEQRLYRQETRYFGIVLSQDDSSLPGHPPITTQPGQWRILSQTGGFIPYACSGTEGQRYHHLKLALNALDTATTLTPEQKTELENRAWNSAINRDVRMLFEIQALALANTQPATQPTPKEADSSTPTTQAAP